MKQLFTAAAVSVALFTAGCSSDSAPAQQAAVTPTASVIPAATPGFSSGLASNGSFSSLAGWVSDTDGADLSGNIQTENDNSVYSITIPAGQANSAEPWQRNLQQIMTINQGKSYTVKFKARSDRERGINVGIGQNGGDYLNSKQTVDLTESWKDFEVTLTATGFGGDLHRLFFEFAGEEGAVMLDEVSIVEVETVVTPDAAPTTAAPVPTEVLTVSVFSDAYVPADGVNVAPSWGGAQTTVVSIEEVADGEVLKYGSLNYQGIDLASPAGSTIDVSMMDTLHLDYWTEASSSLIVSAVSPGPNEKAYNASVTTGSWQSLDIPLDSFTADASNVELSQLMQLKIEGTGTVYLDNIYFYNSNTGRKTVGLYSESTHDASSNSMISTHGGNPVTAQDSAEVTPVDGSVALEIDWTSLLNPNPNWGGATVDFDAPVDASTYTNLVMSVNTNNLPAGFDLEADTPVGDMHVKLEGSGGAGQMFLSEFDGAATVSDGWATLRIPLSSFAGLDVSSVTKIGFWSPETTVATGNQNTTGKMYFDNIYFEGPINQLPTSSVAAGPTPEGSDFLKTSDGSTPTFTAGAAPSVGGDDYSLDTWDNAVTHTDVTEDGYEAIKVDATGNEGWGSVIAFNNAHTGDLNINGYTNFVFKIKGVNKVRVQVVPNETIHDVTAEGVAVADKPGWYQMTIPVPADANGEQVAIYGHVADNADGATYNDAVYYLTDIGFTGTVAPPSAGPTPVGADFLKTSDASNPSFTAGGAPSVGGDDYTLDTWDNAVTHTDVTEDGYDAIKVDASGNGGWGSVLAFNNANAGDLNINGYTDFVFKIKGVDKVRVQVVPNETIHDVTSEGVAVVGMPGWYQMTVPVPATANGQQVAIYGHVGDNVGGTTYQDAIYYVTDIGFIGTATPPAAVPAPTDAPTAPALAAGSVTSLFSDEYADVNMTGWDLHSGSATLVDETISSNLVKKVTGMGYFIAEPAATVNASSYNSLHMDIWLPEVPVGAVLSIKMRDYGANGTWDAALDDAEMEHVLSAGSSPALTQGGWISIDVPLSGIATKGSIGQVIVTGNNLPSMYLDNVYFH